MSRSPSAEKHSPVAQMKLLPSKDIISESPTGMIGSAQRRRRARFGLEGQSSASETSGTEATEDWDQESLSSEDSGTVLASNDASMETRAESLARLKTQLEQGGHSVRSHPASQRRLAGTISPYNSINPFYGYPAQRFLPSTSEAGYGKTPSIRPFHSRRRKRDLIKTLSYLFALRLLAAHRKLKWRLSVAWRIVWDTLVRWEAVAHRRSSSRRTSYDEDNGSNSTTPVKRKKGVHWDAQVALKQEQRQRSWIRTIFWPILVLRRIPRWLIFLALVLFVRSKFFKVRARAIVALTRVRAMEIYEERVRRRIEKLL